VLAIAALALPGCGGSGHSDSAATVTSATTTASPGGKVTGKLPPGAVAPTDTGEQAAEGPAAAEASPEAPAAGPGASGDLSSADRSAVAAVVDDYVAALDRHDARRVCSLLQPGALDLPELPERRGGCPASLRASIGARPRGGGPAWRRTSVVEVKPERLGDDRARVTATVTHHFSDRKYVSVEDDVIYLERSDGRWLLAQPSATLYRAVGYSQPPLRAFSPPSGW
jgi:ketosteroid isomerase-like protein